MIHFNDTTSTVASTGDHRLRTELKKYSTPAVRTSKTMKGQYRKKLVLCRQSAIILADSKASWVRVKALCRARLTNLPRATVHDIVSPIMKETHKFMDGIREVPENIFCFSKVGGVTLEVGSIEVEGQRAVVAVILNLTGYESSISKPYLGGTSSMQSISFEGSSVPTYMSVNEACPFWIDGKQFIIRPVAIGYSHERGEKRRFCEIEVENNSGE